MAEETVKRITGLNPMLHAMSEISTMGMPSFDSSSPGVDVMLVPDAERCRGWSTVNTLWRSEGWGGYALTLDEEVLLSSLRRWNSR